MRLLAHLMMLVPGLSMADGATQATFDIYVRGIRAGVVAISSEERDGRYAGAGRLESVGVVGVFRRVRYDAEVRGRVSDSDFAPDTYVETFRSGGDVERRSMTYRAGVPTVRADEEPDDDDLDPAAQGGTVDPLTAILGVLRDVPETEACAFRAAMFDGERRSRIALGPPRRAGGEIACAGEYRRVAGYSAEDMEKPRFPFRLTYRQAEGGRWQVARIDMQSIFGPGAIVRR